ncbi:hypothetical protein ACA910_017776 [Epithemia clementina (nom. ined.)]
MTNAALGSVINTPPRSKANRITPRHHYSNQPHSVKNNNPVTNNKGSIHKDNKRRNPQTSNADNDSKKHQHAQRSCKRQNVNPTPRKAVEGTLKPGCPVKTDSGRLPEELLDASIPEVAHRIRQRQKMLAKGKNTAGYARYRESVPLEERKTKSMETPTTPNPYVLMSTKRWQGLVRAWRIALHKYDPPELVQSLQHPPQLSAPEIEKESSEYEEGDTEKTMETDSLDDVFGGCQTPKTTRSTTAKLDRPAGVGASITICDADQDDGGVSPCLSVVSRESNRNDSESSCDNNDRKMKDSGACRDLDALFAASSNSSSGNHVLDDETVTDKTLPTGQVPTRRPVLFTGATGWGDEDDSSDEDDDLL